ncbi:MAG: superoxide dismutase family protein [Acidobacteriota bacterium]
MKRLTLYVLAMTSIATVMTTFAADNNGVAPPAKARATLQALGNSGVSGTFLFEGNKDGSVRIRAEIDGLTPGKHGFHIHEFGDCSAADGASAGGHFNPSGHEHGAPGSTSHAGDYGNLEADAKGHASLNVVSTSISLDQGVHGVVGRSVIVHASEDDMKTQPTGNSGGRIACAVIETGGDYKPIKKQAQ